MLNGEAAKCNELEEVLTLNELKTFATAKVFSTAV